MAHPGRRKKNNSGMIVFGVISAVVVLFIIVLLLILNVSGGAPRVVLEPNDVVPYEEVQPESVAISYEWSDTMKGFMASGESSALNVVGEQLEQTCIQFQHDPEIFKFTDGTGGEIPSLKSASEIATDGAEQLVSMMEHDNSQELKIFITDFCGSEATIGEMSKSIIGNIFRDKTNPALAVMGVKSDYNGYINASGGAVRCEGEKPFYVLISGEDTKVSYYLKRFLEYSKIKKMVDEGKLNCEILASNSGIAGIDYSHLDTFFGNENDASQAAGFEAKGEGNPQAVTLEELNRIRATANVEERASVIRVKNQATKGENKATQPKLAYRLKSENAVPAKLKLRVPLHMLSGVNVSSMVPSIKSKVFYLNSKKEFEEYGKDTPNLEIDLEYNRETFYQFARRLILSGSSVDDVITAMNSKLEAIEEQGQGTFSTEDYKKYLSLNEDIKEDTEAVLEEYETADEIIAALEGKQQGLEFSRTSTFPVGVLTSDTDDSVIANLIISDSTKLLDNRSEMIKVQYTIDFGYDQNAIPMWVTEQSCTDDEGYKAGKTKGLSDLFENLYAYLRDSSKKSCSFNVYIKTK